MRHTLAEIKQRLKIISPDIQIIAQEYINQSHKLECKGRICQHVWETAWRNLSQGTGCPQCFRDRLFSGRRLTPKALEKRLGANIKLLKYAGTRSLVTIQCRICDMIWNSDVRVISKCQTCKYPIWRKQITDKYPSLVVLSEKWKSTARIQIACKTCDFHWKVRWGNATQDIGLICRRCTPWKYGKSEAEVREIIERLTGWKFPSIDLPTASPIGMELDGYNVEHKVAFEYQGVDHYKPNWRKKNRLEAQAALIAQRRRDDKKRKRAQRAGIHLIRVPHWKRNVEAFIRAKLDVYFSH